MFTTFNCCSILDKVIFSFFHVYFPLIFHRASKIVNGWHFLLEITCSISSSSSETINCCLNLKAGTDVKLLLASMFWSYNKQINDIHLWTEFWTVETCWTQNTQLIALCWRKFDSSKHDSYQYVLVYGPIGTTHTGPPLDQYILQRTLVQSHRQ